LANLDQDLPNYAQHAVPIHSLPQEWLWCETWCSDDSKEKVCYIYYKIQMKKTIITVDSAMVKNHPAALVFINAHGGSKTFTVKLTLQNISPSLETELCGEMNK